MDPKQILVFIVQWLLLQLGKMIPKVGTWIEEHAPAALALLTAVVDIITQAVHLAYGAGPGPLAAVDTGVPDPGQAFVVNYLGTLLVDNVARKIVWHWLFGKVFGLKVARASIVLLLAGVALSCSIPAHAVPVNLTLTLPLLRSDASCNAAPGDTVKNLATLIVYASTTAQLLDSTLVFTSNVGGLYGRPFPFTAQQPPWSTRYYFSATRDSTDVRSCGRGNVFAVTVTGGPPFRVTDLRAR